MRQWNIINIRYHDVLVSIVVRFSPNSTCYYFKRIDTGLCSCYQCLLIRERSTHDNKNVTFPSTFRHQNQISNIRRRTSFEKGMPTFDRLVTTTEKNPTLALCYCFRDKGQLYRIHLAKHIRCISDHVTLNDGFCRWTLTLFVSPQIWSKFGKAFFAQQNFVARINICFRW